MTLSINGTAIGTIRPGIAQAGGMVIERPASPGNTLVQPYKTGVKPKEFSFQVTVTGASFHTIIDTLDDLCNDEPVVYLSDDVVTLYNNVKASWAVIEEFRVEMIYEGTSKFGIVTFTCTATTDSTGSSYTPP
jgi:hypothetical protein